MTRKDNDDKERTNERTSSVQFSMIQRQSLRAKMQARRAQEHARDALEGIQRLSKPPKSSLSAILQCLFSSLIAKPQRRALSAPTLSFYRSSGFGQEHYLYKDFSLLRVLCKVQSVFKVHCCVHAKTSYCALRFCAGQSDAHTIYIAQAGQGLGGGTWNLRLRILA